MGGGLMQLVAYGAQDIYLTGNPQITFFKVVYRRHTNFSMEAIEQTWNGTQDGSNGRCTSTISRNGDLISKMYIEIGGSGGHIANVNNPGAAFIDTVELEIGGQLIDKQTGLWLEVWAELTEPNEGGSTSNYHTAVHNATAFQRMTMSGGVKGHSTNQAHSYPLFIPLRFWFCRNPGLALPLIALQYHEVKVILNHRMASMFGGSHTQKLYVDYIYLDTDERRRFAQVSHEYLIEQIQFQDVSSTQTDLNFNHPVKELIWCPSTKLGSDGSSPNTAVTGTAVTLKLNGHDRFASRDRAYFTRQQVYDYHTGPGGLNSHHGDASNVIHHGSFNDSIAVYSFALKPEEHQPSGTCNFSRIDNAQLQGLTTSTYTIFAVNYNVLRIMSGMGGLAYSN
tara:strand:- start:259 stop:1440 length:1182 start_codon:yes stop_codon:yes gene_type:complete